MRMLQDINLFLANVPILCLPLKAPENQKFSDVGGFKMGTLAKIGERNCVYTENHVIKKQVSFYLIPHFDCFVYLSCIYHYLCHVASFHFCGVFNPYYTTGLFRYPLKTKNQRFFYVFRGYRKRLVA